MHIVKKAPEVFLYNKQITSISKDLSFEDPSSVRFLNISNNLLESLEGIEQLSNLKDL